MHLRRVEITVDLEGLTAHIITAAYGLKVQPLA